MSTSITALSGSKFAFNLCQASGPKDLLLLLTVANGALPRSHNEIHLLTAECSSVARLDTGESSDQLPSGAPVEHCFTFEELSSEPWLELTASPIVNVS